MPNFVGMAGEIKEKIVFDDSAVIKSLTDQFALVTKVNSAIRETEMTYKEAYEVATKEIDKTNDVIEEGTKVIGDHVKETAKAKAETKGWGSSMKSLADEVNILGVNLGRTIDQLRAKSQAMKSAVSGINAGTNALKIFKVALISTGIGALIVALGSLVAFFTKTERGAEKLERVMAGVGAVISVITDRVSKLGESITKFFSGDFKGAFADAKAAVTGLNEELSREITLMVELKRREQELEDARRANRSEDAKNLVRIKELQLAADDNTKSTKERLAAAKEASKIEKESLDTKLKLAQEDLDITKAQIEAGEVLDSDLDKLTDKEVALQELKVESLSRQRRLQSQLQGIQEESAAKERERLERVLAINKALDDQINKIVDAADKANFQTLDPEQRILAEANAAKAAIEEQFRILDAYAKAAGKEVDLTREKADLIISIEKHTAREIERVKHEGLEDIDELGIQALKGTERAAVDIVGNVQAAVDKMADSPEVKGSILSLSDKLQKAFNIDADTLNGILSGIGNVFDSVFAATNANTDAAIEKNDELLESIRERQELLDDDLEKEKERQKAGLANNLDNKAKEREILAKEEEKALKEQEKLKKKQLLQQLLQDSIQQGSSIVTMATNIAANTSLLGPAGIPVALATIAAFIGIIAKIKSSTKKLSGGGSLTQEGVTGFVNKSGRTDKGSGRGHAVEDSNLVLGGREFVVNENTAMRHADFLEALNRGEFDNGDGLHFAMGHHKEMEHNSAIVGALEARRSSAGIAEALSRAVGTHMSRLASVIQSMPNNYSYTPGDIVVEEKNGKKTLKQTEADWRWKPEPRG